MTLASLVVLHVTNVTGATNRPFDLLVVVIAFVAIDFGNRLPAEQIPGGPQ